MMKKTIVILSISLAHFIASCLILLAGVVESVNGYYPGYVPAKQTVFKRLLTYILYPGNLSLYNIPINIPEGLLSDIIEKSPIAKFILKCILYLFFSLFSGVIFNSLLWGFSLYWIGSYICKHLK